MRGAGLKVLLIGLTLSGSMSADQWTFFHADQVKTFTCTTRGPVSLQVHGAGYVKNVWEAEATAVEADGSTWNFTLAQYNYNQRGKHMAEKACEKWHDQAEARIRRAR